MSNGEENRELKDISDSIKEIDFFIEKRNNLIELAKSPAFKNILVDFEGEKQAALEDYLSNNTPINQAYAKLVNFVCNLFYLYQQPEELENLLAKKEELLEQLQKVRDYMREVASPQQRGGAV